MTKLQYKRLLVKFSGEAVAGDDVHGIDPKILDHMASSVKGVQELGAEIGIVIGGGNLFRGEKLSKAGMDRVAGDHMGMLATVMNGIALRDALERAGVKTRVMSAISMSGLVEHTMTGDLQYSCLVMDMLLFLLQEQEIHSLPLILLDVFVQLKLNQA